MYYIILDLEFNGAYSKRKHRFVNEIIEFGAVKLDEKLNMVDTFCALVTPQISKKLNSHVSKLTHITIDELNESHKTFTHVVSKFRKFMGEDAVLLTWGTTDVLVLMENCLYYFGEQQIPFLSAYCNLQQYCEEALRYEDRAHQMGLSACAERMGIGYDEGALHRALTDAELSAVLFQKLYDPDRFMRLTDRANDEFYCKITFKNYNLTDLRDPLVDRKQMFFLCDNCGRKAHRRSKWHVKNKSFRAKFRCLWCRRDFEGRITFKKCYDCVRIDKRTCEIKKPAPKLAVKPTAT